MTAKHCSATQNTGFRKNAGFSGNRVFRILASMVLLVFPLLAILGHSLESKVSAMAPLAAYCVDVFGSAVLITMIAGHLFAMHGLMHGFRRYIFDIAIWFLLAALMTLPLAAASSLANWTATIDKNIDVGRAKIGLAAIFYLLLIRLLSLVEGIMSLVATLARRFRNQRAP